MISAFRRSLDTWVVRGFFMILLIAFIIWGVGDAVRMIGTSPTWVAKVGGDTIELPTFQSEYQRALNLALRRLPPGQNTTPELRQRIGDSALQQLIREAAIAQEVRHLRIDSPNDAIRAAIVSLPNFHDASGQFSPQMFQTVLANNGYTEARFAELMRGDVAQRQVQEAVTAGAEAPRAEAGPIYTEHFEQRSADMVEFAFATQPAPPVPTDAELQRWYANHPFDYSTPAMKRIKAIVLAPQELEKDMKVSQGDLQAEYQQLKSEFITPPKRSAQVLTVQDQAKATALAAQWRGGADWAAMQAAAQQAGGSGVELDDAANAEFPDAALAKAVFSDAQDAVSDPVHGTLGWFVVKVAKISPGAARPLDQVKGELTKRILTERATDLMYDRANKIDDLLGNGTPLDHLPGDLDLVAVSGTMDAKGDTTEGTPAPIPGSAELRAAIVADAFKADPGEPTELTEVPTPSVGGSAYYALQVEASIPPAVKPYDQVKQQVTADWTAHQVRQAANEAAAKMLVAVKGGQPFAAAAAAAGLPVFHTPPATREAAPQEMPAPLAQVLFGLKPGEPTMVETDKSFIVAVPAKIDDPDPASDPGGYAVVRQALSRSVAGDLTTLFADAVRNRANPEINQVNFDSVVQPQQ
ncbi:MAG TPA: SurA N-terminal domain-containing protein [Acetobacteraceae bacterium]|jgi:peptidyl-prolyl cis-trans isomerase D